MNIIECSEAGYRFSSRHLLGPHAQSQFRTATAAWVLIEVCNQVVQSIVTDGGASQNIHSEDGGMILPTGSNKLILGDDAGVTASHVDFILSKYIRTLQDRFG